jgi:hypothetical protein
MEFVLRNIHWIGLGGFVGAFCIFILPRIEWDFTEDRTDRIRNYGEPKLDD